MGGGVTVWGGVGNSKGWGGLISYVIPCINAGTGDGALGHSAIMTFWCQWGGGCLLGSYEGRCWSQGVRGRKISHHLWGRDARAPLTWSSSKGITTTWMNDSRQKHLLIMMSSVAHEPMYFVRMMEQDWRLWRPQHHWTAWHDEALMQRHWYLKVNHGEDLFAPLNEESSADVQVEVGETVCFSLRTAKQDSWNLCRSRCCAEGVNWDTPGRCPTDGWYNEVAVPSSADCSSSGKRTAGTPPRTSWNDRECPLEADKQTQTFKINTFSVPLTLS